MLSEPAPAQGRPVALCLGGLDPSGGAGLLRDAATLDSLGVFSMAVPLAETVQNGLGCLSIEAPSVSPLARVEALRPHLTGAWGVKIGMCALDIPQMRSLGDWLRELAPEARIWDPILAPSLGASLHDGARLREMAQAVLPGGGWVVCPNLPEARALAGASGALSIDPDLFQIAEPLLDTGARAVWIKGGHREEEGVEDVWVTREGVTSLGVHPRLPGERRGTGCTLASAWLGYRLCGLGDLDAARAAAYWIRSHWNDAFAPGGTGRPCFAPGVA